MNPVDWTQLKNVPPFMVQRYQQLGTSYFDPISPLGVWIDVPGGALTRTFSPGQWKATLSATLRMSGSNGTAYARIQVRSAGLDPVDMANVIMYRAESVLPETESSTQMIMLQGLFTLP